MMTVDDPPLISLSGGDTSPRLLNTNTSTPALTRQSSWNSSLHGSSGDDSDLLGANGDGRMLMESHPTSALTDLMNTFWNPPKIDLDLLDRKLKQASDKVRKTVGRHSSGNAGGEGKVGSHTLSEHREELRRMRAKVALRVDKLSARWAEQKNVRLRDKISFVVGVMNLVCSSLLFAYKPEWMYFSYTLQCAFFLPIRVFTYYRLRYHYFLFDFCYFANLLNLAYIWLFPRSTFLFLACYCSALGPLAFSIATWRNSAVFHSLEKMTSLFIHLYPAITFCALRHFMPEAQRHARFPAMQALPRLNSWTAFAWNVTFYFVWQMMYFIFISRPKAAKIASGERINSYSHMSKGKGAVAKVLAKAPTERREWAFIALQFVYTIVCTLPAPWLFYNSRTASAAFCLSLILLSVWNGAGYYVEVWGRRFERELEKLRKEVEATQKAAAATAPSDSKSTSKELDNDPTTDFASKPSSQFASEEEYEVEEAIRQEDKKDR
jgi:hypothetical protein